MKTQRTATMEKSFSDLEHAAKCKVTKCDRPPGELEVITPWEDLLPALAPHCPKGEGRGRLPMGLAKNTAQRMIIFGLANLMVAKRRFLQLNAHGASLDDGRTATGNPTVPTSNGRIISPKSAEVTTGSVRVSIS